MSAVSFLLYDIDTRKKRQEKNALLKKREKNERISFVFCTPNMTSHHILVALVENKSGVLNRVASLFRKRRFNIRSLNVGETENETVSRMTIEVDGKKTDIQQVIKQLYKIVEVLKVSDITHDEVLIRETILLKVHATNSNRAEVLQFANVFRAKAVDIAPDSLVFEMTSRPEKIEALIDAMRPFGIKEMVRTGVTAMNRGKSGEVKAKN